MKRGIDDASIASLIMQLTAQDLGLGSCWIQVRERFHSNHGKAEDYIKGVLGIPEKYHVQSIIVVSYPAEEKRAYDENELLYDRTLPRNQLCLNRR